MSSDRRRLAADIGTIGRSHADLAHGTMHRLGARSLTEEPGNTHRARALLAEAGYAEGFSATIMTSPAYQEMVADAQIVQAQLRAIGIELEIEQEAWDVYVDRWLNRDFEMYSGINSQFSDDPDYSLYPALHTGGPWNVSEFSNPDVDRLLEAGRTTLDAAVRKDMYDQLQHLLAEQAPLLWTYSGEISDAVSTRLNGYSILPNESRASLRASWLVAEDQEQSSSLYLMADAGHMRRPEREIILDVCASARSPRQRQSIKLRTCPCS